jgi:hypothetical protein
MPDSVQATNMTGNVIADKMGDVNIFHQGTEGTQKKKKHMSICKELM